MNMPGVSSARGKPVATAGRWMNGARHVEQGLVALLLFAVIFTFPDYPAVSLDPSWRLVLTRAFYDGLQFGHDIVFTYGPLGFLMGNTYDGVHFWGLITWQLVKAVAFAAIIMHAADRLPVVARWACFAAFLLFGVYIEDTLHRMIVVLLGAWCVREDEPPGPRASLAIGAGLAWLSAIKFTNLLLAAAIVVMAASLHLRSARQKTAGMLVLGYVGGFAAIWLMARQSLWRFPEYLLNAWRISHGYEEAMGLPPPAVALWKALVIGVLLSLYLGLHLVLHRRQSGAVVAVLLLVAYGFATWKHGFIRADGHMGDFFIGMLLLAALAPALLGGMKRFRVMKWGMLALVAFISVWGLDETFTITRSTAWAVFTEKITGQLDHLAHWKTFRAGYDLELRRLCAAQPLDRTRAMVGRASLDVLGHDTGIVCLLGMNYRPRPVFQGYSAYTPALARLNRDYYLSARAPEFVLQKLQTIDDRLPSLDDSLVFRLLPQLYEFVLAEDGFLLWRRRPAPVPANAAPVLLAGDLAPGELLRVDRFADKPLWLELDLPLSLRGRLRAVGYQPPFVHLRLTDTSGGSTDYRLPPAQARGGFILNPIIDDAADYLTFVSGEPRRRVQSLVVVIEPDDRRFFADRFRFSLTGVYLPRVEKSLEREACRARFHMFKALPDSETAFVPFAEAEIDGHPVIVAHAPSELRFELPPHASRITGSFGFIQGAYSDGGQTDGATFLMTWTDGRERETLFSRRLDPVHVSSDRGLQTFSVDLGDWHGGELLLEVDPGPKGDNSWDWTAWSDVEIQEGLGK